MGKNLQGTWSKITGPLTSLFGSGTKNPGILAKIGGAISTATGLTQAKSLLKNIGKVLGKIFAPVTIIWGIVEAISGFVKGYEQGGVVGGLQGAFENLFNFLIGDIFKFIMKIPTAILSWIGLESTAKLITKNVDGFVESVTKLGKDVIGVIGGIFTLDMKLLKESALSALGNFTDVVGWAVSTIVDPLVDTVVRFFFISDEEEKNYKPFSFKTDIVDPVVRKVKEWWNGLISLGVGADGSFSLSTFVNQVEVKITEWWDGVISGFMDLGKARDKDGKPIQGSEFSLSALVTNAWADVKKVFTDAFSWSGLKETFTLDGHVKKVWESVKTWFTDLFTWAETDVDETTGEKDGIIISTIKTGVNEIKRFFGKLISFENLESTLATFVNVAMFFPNLVLTALGNFTSWFAGVIGFDETATKIKEWTDKFSIGKLVIDAITGVWNWIKPLFTDPSEWLKTQWKNLTAMGGSVGEWLWSKLKGMWDWFTDLFPSGSDIKQTISTKWEALTGMKDSVGAYLSDKISGAGDWIKSKFENLKKDFLASVPEWMKNPGQWMAKKFEPVGEFFGKLFDFESHIKAIKEWFATEAPAPVQWGLRKVGFLPETEEEKKFRKDTASVGSVSLGGFANVNRQLQPQKKVLTDPQKKVLTDLDKIINDKIKPDGAWDFNESAAMRERLKSRTTPASQKLLKHLNHREQEMLEMLGMTESPVKPVDDFIWRPGQPIQPFNKGDLLMAIHEKTAKTTGNMSDSQVLNRMDKLIETQQKTLTVLQESGLMDKQGNTVVNSGGNSTTINNTSHESHISDFRGQVLGRLNQTGNKY